MIYDNSQAKEWGRIGGDRNGNRQKAKTHCPRGHSYSPENTYNHPDGFRVCRICKRASYKK